MEIDINVDMGEGFGLYKIAEDEAIMPFISSANIACGFHAGDPVIINKTVKMAKRFNLAIGAHPGFPDRQGFGRREIVMTSEELYSDIVYQIGALKVFVEKEGLHLHHVKPHGKLYGLAHSNKVIAEVICRAINDIDKNLYLYCMKKGYLSEVAESMGIKTVFEVYSDLDCDDEGNLIITRKHSKKSEKEIVERVLTMVNQKKVKTISGNYIPIEGNSICVHSDTPGSVEIAKSINKALRENGYNIVFP